MAISIVSSPRPNHCPLSQLPRAPAPSGGQLALSWRFPPTPPKLITIALCSTSTSTPVVEDGLPPPSAAISGQPESTVDSVEKRSIPPGGCTVCGKEEIEKGCNGEGSIQGGIATVPGFGWWPIKAYRPCPGFVASGGRYRRRGQSMDEVAFGRGGPSSSTPVKSNPAVETSKKQKDSKKSKS